MHQDMTPLTITVVNFSTQKYLVIFPYQKTATAMARPSSSGSIMGNVTCFFYIFHGTILHCIFNTLFLFFFNIMCVLLCRDLQTHVALKIWRMKNSAKVRGSWHILPS